MMLKRRKKTKILVALSGGVDSSVAALLLLQRGFQVEGAYFKTYHPFGDRRFCREAGKSAALVAKTLGIPFHVFDLQEAYRDRVFSYFIEGYRQGKTPNPDIICNREIKFGLFAKEAFALGADYIATGHYARRIHLPGFLRLCEAKDKRKDQSYFLAQISPEVLKRTIFPLGQYEKTQVRRIAKEAGLHTADKKDSQGICFLQHEADLYAFLQHFIPPTPGEVRDCQSGAVIGTHQGVMFYTVGQRHGFHIFPEAQSPNMPPLYVVGKDVEKNILWVGSRALLEQIQARIEALELASVQWWRRPPKEELAVLLRIRHRGEKTKATLQRRQGRWILQLQEPVFAPAEGQFAVLYRGHCVVASGEIARVVKKEPICG